jgi:ribosome-associated translation inhibitor RaiA
MLHSPYLIDVRLTHDRHHRQGKVITCRLNIKQGGEVFHSERAADTVQNAVDLTVAAAKQELQKYRDKLKP